VITTVRQMIPGTKKDPVVSDQVLEKMVPAAGIEPATY
jgi:hypothetical protein